MLTPLVSILLPTLPGLVSGCARFAAHPAPTLQEGTGAAAFAGVSLRYW